jgi:hypothetical protein
MNKRNDKYNDLTKSNYYIYFTNTQYLDLCCNYNITDEGIYKMVNMQ